MRKLILPVLFGAVMTLVGCSHNGEGMDDDGPVNFTVTIENIAPVKAFIGSGVFNIPVGDSEPGAASPGKMFEFTFDAGRSQKLSFATMLAATNDLFFAPGADGIALYNGSGEPLSGDVTDQVYLWDAGTEINEEPAVGPNTVTNQGAPNTGEDENGNVLLIQDVTTGFAFDYPAVSEIINVTLTHVAGTQFKLTIEDLSSALLQTSEGDKPAPISPGVYVIHSGKNPLFIEGMPDLGQGIEAIAEDGNPEPLGMYVEPNTGVTYPASPGGWVVHQEGTKPMFTEGMPDYGDGVEGIAEDGSAMALGSNLSSLDGYVEGAVFDMPVGSSTAGAILPGNKFEFSFEAEEGENLSFATMLAATNDVFFGPADGGIALFNSYGEPINGDITNEIYLWDVGTELNEQPAIGPNTVTNQLAPNTGIDEDESVRLLSDVNDGYMYPEVNTILKVAIKSN